MRSVIFALASRAFSRAPLPFGCSVPPGASLSSPGSPMRIFLSFSAALSFFAPFIRSPGVAPFFTLTAKKRTLSPVRMTLPAHSFAPSPSGSPYFFFLRYWLTLLRSPKRAEEPSSLEMCRT